MNYFSDKLYIVDNCQRPIYFLTDDNSNYTFYPPKVFHAVQFANRYSLFLRFHKQVGTPIGGQVNDIYVDTNNCISLYATDHNYTYARMTDNVGAAVQIPVFPLTPSRASEYPDVQRIDSTYADSLNHRIEEINAADNTDSENEYAPPKSVLVKVSEGITHYLGENDLCFKDKTLCRSIETRIEPKGGEEFPTVQTNYEKIANYCLIPVCSEEHHYYDRVEQVIQISIVSPLDPSPISITVNGTDIERISKIIQKHRPGLYLNPDFKRTDKYVAASISMQLTVIPQTLIYHYSGWQKIRTAVTYNLPVISTTYLNDKLEGGSLLRCITGKRLEYSPQITRGDAFQNVVKMLFLSEDMSKTLPLLLFAHLGIMYKLFEDAGFPPRFVLFLCGQTGSLKTSVSKVFFKILKDSANDIPANFNDTMTALEIKMGNTYDDVLLVDDFRPSSMRSELARMRNNLEKLIRFYGDGIGKGRGDVTLRLRNEFKPHGVCAVTGEYIHGTASSLQRLLIINIEKNTFNRSLLKYFQDNPMYYLTHMRFFVDYLSARYDETVKYIKDNFLPKREVNGMRLSSRRLTDASVCLELVSDILLQYADDMGLVYRADIQPQSNEWKRAIMNIAVDSEGLSIHLEPADMYCYAMMCCIREGRLKIAEDKNTMAGSDEYAGFIDKSKRLLRVRPDITIFEVRRYWGNNGRSFNVTDKAVRQELLLNNYIIGQSDGVSEKTAPNVNFGGRQIRMLAFDLDKLEKEYGKL